MNENELSKIVVNTCYDIHVELGPGLLESVYEEVLHYELVQLGLKVERQKSIPLIWDNTNMGMAFRADLIVENKLLIELKSVEKVPTVAYKQVKTYLRLTDLKLGLIVNFGEKLIKTGITRVVNGL